MSEDSAKLVIYPCEKSMAIKRELIGECGPQYLGMGQRNRIWK